MATKPSVTTPSSKSSIPFLEAPRPPEPPRFPTLEELLGVELQEPPPKHTGLLYELLGGSPMPIYNDAQASPDKYQPEDVELLERIVARGPKARGSLACGCPAEHWEMSEAERRRLDQMTMTFATAKRIDPPPIVRPAVRKKVREVESTPITDMPSFWWLKKEGR